MKRQGIAAFILIILLTSCEKEKEYGRALYEGDEMINYLFWSENSDEIYFAVERENYRKTLYGVGINSGDSWKICDFVASYGVPMYQKETKIYYFNDMVYQNTKLYSIDKTGGSPVMIIDSLESPQFSKKYVAFLRSYYFPDTSYTKTILYDLENNTERIIESDRNYSPVTISPDGSTLLLMWWANYGMPHLTLYDTESGIYTDLPASENLYIFKSFWRDNEVYSFRESGTGIFTVNNLVSRQKLSWPEPLTFGHEYSVSPTGTIIAYIVTEPPALAEGLVGNHYYLHILREGSSVKEVYDMARDEISGGLLTFSPDETRVAYIRGNTDIFILTLN